MANQELAYDDYLAGMKQKDIAAKYGASINTVKAWYTRKWKKWKEKGYKSAREALEAEKDAQPEKVCTPKEKSVHTKKDAHQKENTVDRAIAKSLAGNEALSERERIFCAHYIKTFNRKAAVIKAGYTEKWPNEIAYQLLQKPTVKAELKKLRAIKLEQQELATADDVIELHMRIAFSDITDFVSFGKRMEPVIGIYGPVKVNGEVLEQEVNYVDLKEPDQIDGQVVNEVKNGKDGAVVKLADRQRSLSLLERYFELNPMDRHKKEYDMARLELEKEKVKKDDGGDKRTCLVDDVPDDDDE